MNLEIQEQCLICLTSIVKPGREVAPNQQQNVAKVDSGYGFPTVSNFQELCEYLKIEFPLNSLKFKNVSRLLTGSCNQSKSCCESLLCSKCLEMVSGLSLIYNDLRRVQRRIDYEIRAIQEVVKRTDKGSEDNNVSKKDKEKDSNHNSNDGSSGGEEVGGATEGGDQQQDGKRKKIERMNSGSGVSSSIVADYLEFVETFRTLVKEVKTVEPEPVVLSDEAETLAKFYEEMEEAPEMDLEFNNEDQSSSSSPPEIPSNGNPGTSTGGASTTVYYIVNRNPIKGTNGTNGNTLTILPTGGVSLVENDEDSQENSVEVEVTIEEDEEMDFAPSSPCSSGSSDLLSPFGLPNRKSRAVKMTCRFCNQIFNSPIAYYKHRKSVHPSESKALIIPSYNGSSPPTPNRTGSCPLCWENKTTKKYTNTFLQFMEHMLSHELLTNPITTVPENTVGLPDDIKPYACDHCDQRFLQEMNLDLHKICYHESNLIQLRCKECGDVSSESWEDLVSHLVVHHGCDSFYSCKSCPMAFVTADQLLEHMETHILSKRLPCSECPSVSPSLKELYQHYNQVHPNLLTPLKCGICKEIFSMPSTYKRHLSRDHLPATASTSSALTVSTSDSAQQSVQCPHCMEVKTFKNKTTLENHIRIHHDTTVDKHRCEECGKAFVHRSTLRYHMQQVHLGIRYPCPQCPKSFTAKSLLKGHLKLHNGQGPPVIPCPHCGKIMASLTALKAHISTQHEDNQPVKCDICGREFSNLYSMRGHKSEVHNLKQFPCPHCPLSFAWLRKFKQHMKAVHPNQSIEEETFESMFPIQIMTVGSVNGFVSMQ